MTNKELQEHLKLYPDDATVTIEYCNVQEVWYRDADNILVLE